MQNCRAILVDHPSLARNRVVVPRGIFEEAATQSHREIVYSKAVSAICNQDRKLPHILDMIGTLATAQRRHKVALKLSLALRSHKALRVYFALHLP